MTEHVNETPNQSNCDNQAASYLGKAGEACASGDLVLGMHLYLAAYEQAATDPDTPTQYEVAALQKAWQLACDLKERALAEYAFEKLEPYLTGEEIAEHAMKLQELALDRLEQYGFTREELEDMAEVISQDFIGEDAHVVKVESISIPNMGMFGVPVQPAVSEPEKDAPAPESEAFEGAASASTPDELEPETRHGEKPPHVGMGIAKVEDFNPYEEYYSDSVGTSYHAATNEGSGAYAFTRDPNRASALERAKAKEAEQAMEAARAEEDLQARQTQKPAGEQGASPDADSMKDHLEQIAASTLDNVEKVEAASRTAVVQAPSQDQGAVSDAQGPALNYRTLAGYGQTVATMRDMGIGMRNNEAFRSFVRSMNGYHGLDRMPAVDTILFRSPAIEDASRFAEATIGELGLPVLHMAMEEGFGGAPVLCVTAQGNNRPRMNRAHNRFEGPGILVIDDLDMWIMPEMPENPEGLAGFMMANISRGAREAVNLIRASVEDPEVLVLATASTSGRPDPIFYEMLEPITIVDIAAPNDSERAEIWKDIFKTHPSFQDVSIDDLVRFSRGLARYDIYMAAREAVEEAYKAGLARRTYLPVKPQNIFDRLAAYHPLDSEEYRSLEKAVLDDFRNDLDHLEDLLRDEE